jgi:sec-independent protein translocase protein TatA
MPLRLPELLIILAVLVLIFGARRLPELGSSMGKTIREFRKSLNEHDAAQAPQLPPPAAPGSEPPADR